MQQGPEEGLYKVIRRACVPLLTLSGMEWWLLRVVHTPPPPAKNIEGSRSSFENFHDIYNEANLHIVNIYNYANYIHSHVPLKTCRNT